MCAYRSSASRDRDSARTPEDNAPTEPDDNKDALAEMLSSLVLDNAEMEKNVKLSKQQIVDINSEMKAGFSPGVATPTASPETTTGKRTRSDISELGTAQHQNKHAHSEALDIRSYSTEDLLQRIAQERRLRDELFLQTKLNQLEIERLQKEHSTWVAQLTELRKRVLK